MQSDPTNHSQHPHNPCSIASVAEDEGGLRAPPGLTGWRKAWWWFDFIILVKLARLRFIAVLVLIGVVITQWDTLNAHYEKWTRRANEVAGGASADVEWFCPMHPSVVRDNGKDKCPVCFMPLSRRKKGETHQATLPAGVVNRVQLSPYRVVLAGVNRWRVDYQPLKKQIRAVGFVDFNEREFKTVSARVKGRIDTLNVNETGQMVDAGDILASLYSPDLNVTVQNLLDAKRRNSAAMVESSRQRLQLLGISDDQIDEILKTGKANSHLRIRSPVNGHVIKKYVREGQYVDEGSPLYDIADLATVWIQAQVYEDDLAFLPTDQSHKPTAGAELPVTATARAFAGEPFHGTLAFIYPHVDQETRTVTVRCEIKNPGHRLRPGSTATVSIDVRPEDIPSLAKQFAGESAGTARQMLKAGRVLAVPESSVIDTGNQTIVYRETLPGTFEGTLVELGPKMRGTDEVAYFPVLHGLSLGDQIVTAGSFLVDAETRLNPAAGSIYIGGTGGSKSGASSVTAIRPSTPDDADAKVAAALAKLPEADRKLAEAQKFCPVLTGSRLGSMGVPVKVLVDGEPVFLCCPACRAGALENPKETLSKVRELKLKKGGTKSAPTPGSGPTPKPSEAPTTKRDPEIKIQAALAKLSPEDRTMAELQKFCPVLPKSRLGSMGPPEKVMIGNEPVFVCCAACKAAAVVGGDTTLQKVKQLRSKKEKKEE